MKECSKSIARRLSNSNFSNKYFRGEGVDIGGKPDPLKMYQSLFPLMQDVRTWDWEDGDAQFLASVGDSEFDFVHSSHCLEHLMDPKEGLRNWIRVLKPDGYLVLTVPDEDMYEQGIFPSTFNLDHKWTFTIYKYSSWSDRSINVIDLVRSIGDDVCIEKIELLNSTYRDEFPRYDQTITPIGECGIEVVIRKRVKDEIANKGKLPKQVKLGKEHRIHLNQYKDDQAAMKNNNQTKPPFTNEADI